MKNVELSKVLLWLSRSMPRGAEMRDLDTLLNRSTNKLPTSTIISWKVFRPTSWIIRFHMPRQKETPEKAYAPRKTSPPRVWISNGLVSRNSLRWNLIRSRKILVSRPMR